MTDQTRIFQLERLYVTMTGQDGQSPTLQIMARTPGIRRDVLAECRRAANLMPPPPEQCCPDMPGSFGLFRSERLDYILAKAQQSPSGIPQFQYLLVPSAALRWLGGNIRLFEGFAREAIPEYATPRTDLPPFVLENPEPPDNDTQTNDILALMDFCKNNLKIVGGLLAALVQAMGLGILNAPLSLHDRITFVQALLSLLPIPARMAITFATSVIDSGQTNSQIKFLASDVRPARHVIFDWAAGKLLTDPPDDSYAKFIMTQLRLDTSLVLQQTEKLSRTAVWRAMRKDDLGNALAWVSRRAKIDSAIETGQAVDRAQVASVLGEDPTLSPELRITYSRHLLTISLALDDPTQADIIPAIAMQNRDLSDAVFEQLQSAALGDHALAVYHLVSRWVTQPPAGADVSRWLPLVRVALLAQLARLIKGEPEPLAQFLEQCLTLPETLHPETLVPEIIAISRKRGYDNADVARLVFLLAVTYLPAGGLQRLLADAQLIAQFPEPLRVVFPHLVPEMVKPAPPALLAKGSEVYGTTYQPNILVRLVEWALYLQRLDLIDLDAVKEMIRVAKSPRGKHFDVMLQNLVEDLSRLNVLKTLDVHMPQYLVELSMARGRYTDAIRQLEFYQTTLYRGTKQEDLAEITRAVFRDAPLDIPQITEAFQAMQDSQLKPTARANAFLGALEAQNWASSMELAARRMTALICADPRQVELIGLESAMRLLSANAERKDAVEALRLAGALVEYALVLGASAGQDLINQVYPLINWSPEVSQTALEILRTYVRRAPLEQAKDLPHQLGQKYGEGVEHMLDATHRLRIMLDGIDFMAFAERLHFAAPLLIDMATTYHHTRELPPIYKLRRTVEGMPGGLANEERERLADNLNRAGLQILKLAQLGGRKRGNEAELYRQQLFKGSTPPTNGIDALHWMGGHFGNDQVYPLKLERQAPPHLLGSRSVNTLLHETDMMVHLFDALMVAFPEKDPFVVDNAAWASEVDSVWDLLSLYKQRQVQRVLGEDAQLLAQVVKAVGDKGHERSFQSSGYGRQLQTGRAQPRSVIDALRWLSGYFARQHT